MSSIGITPELANIQTEHQRYYDSKPLEERKATCVDALIRWGRNGWLNHHDGPNILDDDALFDVTIKYLAVEEERDAWEDAQSTALNVLELTYGITWSDRV